jgi:hypothetical protein
LNVDVNGFTAVQHARKHENAVFRKSVG